jgi:hypothetical protein
MNNQENSQLIWKIFRLTENAISMIDAGKLDEALEIVDNRERALNIISKKSNLTEQDMQTLQGLDRLNNVLLEKFVQAREKLKSEIQTTHLNNEAHKAYHSGQVK